MNGSSDWLDSHVGAAAWETLLRQLGEGRRRVVVWGPAGGGKSTLLRRLAGAIAEGSACDALLVDTASAEEARRALAAAPPAQTIVIAAHVRAGLEADAYVECAPLPIDDGSAGSALAFLRRLMERDGAPPPAEPAVLADLARHTEGLPGAVRRASELLRLMSPRELVARCDEALHELLLRGRLVEHPLEHAFESAAIGSSLRDDGTSSAATHGIDGMDDALCEAAALLLAAGEPLPMRLAERLLPSRLDALLALRDRGALLVSPDGRVGLRIGVARALAKSPGFSTAFGAAAARIDAHVIDAARTACERWMASGDEAAIDAIAEHEGRLERAAERALPLAAGDSGVAARLADAVLALQTSVEVRRGPRAGGELLARAFEAIGGAEAGREVALARAHWLRLAGDMEGVEKVLATLDPDTLPAPLAARWHVERAHTLRYHRKLDEALPHLERACALSAAHGPAHDEARHTIELGGLRYWQERFEDAIALFTRGRMLAARLGARRTQAIALSNLCLCHGMAGDESKAAERGAEAVALFRDVDDSGALGTTLGHLGILAYQYGRLDDAERFLAEAEERVEQAGYFEQRVNVRFNRTCVALAAGRIARAEEWLRSLSPMLAASPSPLVSLHLERLESDLHEHRGRLAEARAALERGLAIVPASASIEGRATLAAQLARVLARLGEHAASERAAADAATALEAVARDELRAPCELVLEHAAFLRGGPARTKLVEALRPAWEGAAARTRIGVSAVDSGAVREAAMMYWRDLPPAERVVVEWAARDPSSVAVCIDEASERARLPGGQEIDAAARRNAQRLLALLANAGDEGRTREELIEAMWPGERMREDAAVNRLHNALAQLRSLGLAPFLVREQVRYRLSGVRVILAGRADPFTRA